MDKKVLNVVILGKVGTGKKTLGNHIVGADIFQQKSLAGAVHYKDQIKGNTVYQILTVDTEGLQSDYNDPLPSIEQTFNEIHLIIFVIDYCRYTDESHSSLIRVIESFDTKAKMLCALVITHCEGIKVEERRGIAVEFSTDTRTSQVANFCKKGIYTVGFPDISRMTSELRQIYQKEIGEYEIIIRKLVKDCEVPLLVKSLLLHDNHLQDDHLQDDDIKSGCCRCWCNC